MTTNHLMLARTACTVGSSRQLLQTRGETKMTITTDMTEATVLLTQLLSAVRLVKCTMPKKQISR
jgi:DNA polymerase/3'-5' exonuclease PolX